MLSTKRSRLARNAMKNYARVAVILLLVILLMVSACSDNDTAPLPDFSFTKIGLDNLKVYELCLYHDDTIYAATNDGVYAKRIGSSDPFALVGLKGRNVLDVIVFSQQHIIASTGNRGFSVDDPGIFETVNGGGMWEKFTFGDGVDEETAHSLSQHPTQASVIYATGNAVVAKSVNYGRNWEIIWGSWNGFASGTAVAEVNPFKNTDMWFGGQGGIENGYIGLLRNEQPVKQWTDLVSNPTVAVEIAYTNEEKQNIYVGFEGALMKTANDGLEWEQLIDGHGDHIRFFYGIGKSNKNRKNVYAGGWLKGVDHQSLVLYLSDDSGSSWETKVFDTEQSGGIFDLKVISENGADRIFVGLDGGGVYEITMKF